MKKLIFTALFLLGTSMFAFSQNPEAEAAEEVQTEETTTADEAEEVVETEVAE